MIRYNTTTSQFEGYGPGSSWGSLGGVKDVDGDTYILAETSAGNDNDDLQFFTAGSQRMVILDSGNVGIGGTDNSGKLNIKGGGILLRQASVYTGSRPPAPTSSDTNAYDYEICSRYDNSKGFLRLIAGLDFNNSRIELSAHSGSVSHDTDRNIAFFTNNTEQMRINYQGNVGIGTDAPTGGKLHVVGDIYTTGKILGEVGGSNLIVGGTTYQSATAPTNGMLVEGYVGFGTDSPFYRFHIHEPTNDAVLAIESGRNSTNTKAIIMFRTDDTVSRTYGFDAAKIVSGFYDTAYTNSYISFQTHHSDNNTFNDSMTIRGGNVGIGTTSPDEKLDIAGVTITKGLQLISSDVNNNNITRPAIATRSSTVGIKDYEIAAIPHYYTNKTSNYGANNGFLRIRAGGGSAAGTTSYIDLTGYAASGYTDMNQNIVFGTSGTERMRILNNGNVGIGTDNPSACLQINATAVDPSTATMSGSNSQGSLRLQGVGPSTFMDFGMALNSPYGGWIQTHNGNSTDETGEFILLQPVRGNVVIGSTGYDALTNKLEVKGGNLLVRRDGSTDTAQIAIRGGGGHSSYIRTQSDGKFILDSYDYTKTMTLQSNGGNVGIGTTDPYGKVEISDDWTNNGNAEAKAYLNFSNTNATYPSRWQIGPWKNGSGHKVFGIRGGGSTTDFTALNSLFTVHYDGYVGINQETNLSMGTGFKLQVNGLGVFCNNGTKANSVSIGDNGIRAIIESRSTTHNLEFWVNGSSRLAIKADGNVGIGTTSPGYALDVVGDIRGSGNIGLGEGHRLSWSDEYTSSAFGAIDGGQNYLKFLTNSAYRMTIDSAGNVGIGTTSPNAKLDVNGEINAERITFSGGSTGTRNVFIGQNAGNSWTSGNGSNIAIGEDAMKDDTYGMANVAIGYKAGRMGTNGNSGENVYIGDEVCSTGYTGGGNVIIGAEAGKNLGGTTTNSYNNSYGNVVVGNYAGGQMGNCRENICIGRYAGWNNKTGNDNINIGYYANNKSADDGLSNRLNIGNGASQSNHGVDSFIHGNMTSGSETLIINAKVGIGTTSPGDLLHIESGASETRLRIKNTASGGGSVIRMQSANNQNSIIWQDDNDKFVVRASDGIPLYLGANNVNDHMVIATTGYVGIGRTDPQSLLNISKDGGDAILRIQTIGGNVNLAGIEFWTDDSTSSVGGTYPASRILSSFTGTTYDTCYLKFQTHHSNSSTYNDTMTIKGNKVGIGTTSPTNKCNLHSLDGSEGFTVTRNNVDTFTFLGYDNLDCFSSSTQTGIPQNSPSMLYLQYHSKGDMSVCQNGGNVGIGTGSTWCPLYVYGYEDGSSSSSQKAYWHSGETTTTAGYNYDISISCRGAIWVSGGGVIVSSDQRIKTNIREVPDNLSLQKLRDISCCYYGYKDTISRGDEDTIGFIAQQVKEHMPLAVSTYKHVIPNEMRKLTNISWEEIIDGSNNTYKLTTDLSDCSDVKYKFYVSNDISGEEIEKEVVGNNDNTFTFDSSYNNVFCYGKEVDDFHTLDKDKLFTINFSATQEIDRIQQQEITKVQTLQTDLSTANTTIQSHETTIQQQATKITTLETQIADILTRLSNLENSN